MAKGPLVIPMVDTKTSRVYVRKTPKDTLDVGPLAENFRSSLEINHDATLQLPDGSAIDDRFEAAGTITANTTENGPAPAFSSAAPADAMAVDGDTKPQIDVLKKEAIEAAGTTNVKYGLNVKKEAGYDSKPTKREFAPGDVPLAMRNRPTELYVFFLSSLLPFLSSCLYVYLYIFLYPYM